MLPWFICCFISPGTSEKLCNKGPNIGSAHLFEMRATFGRSNVNDHHDLFVIEVCLPELVQVSFMFLLSGCYPITNESEICSIKMKQEQRHEIYNAIKTTLEWGSSNRCRNRMQREIKLDIRVGINWISFSRCFDASNTTGQGWYPDFNS